METLGQLCPSLIVARSERVKLYTFPESERVNALVQEVKELLHIVQVIEPVLTMAAALSVQSPFSRVPLGHNDITVSHPLLDQSQLCSNC